ncbi:MAG: trimethyllysine dioxygenase [Actinomycetes bacterium]|jgi:trimethyllysine dioxygenase|uniref:trimethyllysine dioxygenase n=1 Tax=freshwater metagenome TaxID=449393 RepID=A0A6J6CFU3_9ZZZZ|nr:trimethyllysine dioxygenase [Actinomycetota bacterium]
MTGISRISRHDDRLELGWDDGVTSSHPWIWLRDHAHDEATLHPVTQQRQLWTAGLSVDLAPAAAADVEGDELVVVWADGDRAALPVAFLERFRAPSAPTARIDRDRVLWDADAIRDTPRIDHDEVMEADDGVTRWLELVARYGFCIVTGTPATAEATEALARRVGYVRETIFGGFWEFTADMSKADTAYTNLELRPHTDGTYSHDAPGLQMLHCLYFDGEGGESTMVDGFRIAQELRDRSPEQYALLASVAIPGQYLGDGSHLVAARPVFRHDHTGELVQVSFNNADRAPFVLPHDEMVAVYRALQAFDLLANDLSLQWRHVLRPGEALLFDNWRVLHGRTAYTGTRRLCGAYLNHEDFESRLRLAGPTRTATAGSPA